MDYNTTSAYGGIICYVRGGIPVVNEWEELDAKDLETLWITILPQHMPREFSHITIGVIYHPPKADDWTMCQHITECIDRILQKYLRSGLVICGVFNHMKDSYLKNSYKLNQLVTKPTHMNSKLDLFYTNMKNHYGTPTHQAGIGLSKHLVIIQGLTGKSRQVC